MKYVVPLLVCLLTASVQAKTLYVNIDTGNDSTSYAENSEDMPWQSLGRATWGSSDRNNPAAEEAAQAGDTVIVSAGIYSTNASSGERHIPIYNPVNSGTYGQPITIQTEGNVQLRANVGSQPVIGTYQRAYIVWDGFILDEAYISPAADTGPLVVWRSDHVTIQNMYITGIDPGYIDNHNGIRIEASRQINIVNNQIENFNLGNATMNYACIMAYDSEDVLIEHNVCSSANTGIFIKGNHLGVGYDLQAFTIRYNHIFDSSIAIQFGGVGGDASCSNATEVYQNLIDNVWAGVSFIGYDNITPACVSVVNNTFHNIGDSNEAGAIQLRPGYTGYRGLKFHNNLVMASSAAVNAWQTAFNNSPSETVFSHNNYYNSMSNTVAYVAYTEQTLTQWQNNFAKDTDSSTALDPHTVGVDDFRLQNTSPLIDAGLDVLDLNDNGLFTDSIAIGAYITGDEVIGLSDVLYNPYPALPDPPANFTVQRITE